MHSPIYYNDNLFEILAWKIFLHAKLDVNISEFYFDNISKVCSIHGKKKLDVIQEVNTINHEWTMTCLIFFKSTIIILLRDGSGSTLEDFISMSCAVCHNKYNPAASHAVCTNRKEMTGN